MRAFSRASALIYFLKAFSVLCPLIAITKVRGVPAKNSFVQKERLQVCEVTQAYFGRISSIISFPRLYENLIGSSIPASLAISFIQQLKSTLLTGGICMLYFRRIARASGCNGTRFNLGKAQKDHIEFCIFENKISSHADLSRIQLFLPKNIIGLICYGLL
jgi:hypothetical protein